MGCKRVIGIGPVTLSSSLEELNAPITEFDEQLWISVVVHRKENIRVVYRDGIDKYEKQERHIMKKIIMLCALSAMIMAGCSRNQESNEALTEIETTEKEATNLKSEEFASEDDFWKCAESEYSSSFQEVRDRKKTFSFVVLDGIIATCERVSDNEIELTVGYEMDDGSYLFFKESYSNLSTSKARYGEELLDTLEIDDVVRICYYNVNSDGVDFRNLVGIKKIGHNDHFVEQYLAANSTEKSDTTDVSEKETFDDTKSVGTKRTPSSVKFGTLLDVNPDGGGEGNTLVIKVKIEPNLTNEMTISQNYHNVIDIVKDQKCDSYDSIDYWAVADMTDGSEGKVISFTLDKSVINGIKEGNIVATTLKDYLTDLWILPSLLE